MNRSTIAISEQEQPSRCGDINDFNSMLIEPLQLYVDKLSSNVSNVASEDYVRLKRSNKSFTMRSNF